MHLTRAILVMCLYTCVGQAVDIKQASACHGSTLHIGCTDGKTIRIDRANYGRTSRLLCLHPAMSNTNCGFPNAVKIVSNRCDHRTKCSVLATHLVFGDPCVGTFKYLQVAYRCIKSDTRHIKRVIACHGSTLRILCTGGKTISVLRANYGRTNRAQCIHPAMSNTNCGFPNAVNIVSNSCNAVSSCTVPSSHLVFGDPCVGTFKYLDVTYTCN